MIRLPQSKGRFLFAVFVAVAGLGLFYLPESAHAANPADFNAGRIIDDEVFYNQGGMGGVGDIQAFLNAHVPSCDTWGTGASGYGKLTNAQYAQQIKGWPGPPYVCLNNYYENPTTGQTSYEMGGGAFSGGLSAAQIIYDAAQQYRINPKVLIITLRKESLNLFGDSWPMKSQYKYAMGYACPDSGPNFSAACVDSKSGFYKQVTLAAWQLRYYYDHMGSYNYAPGRWNTIQYSPDPNCGTKDVYIQNYATASLYIYTPYTPNNAAINAYPGTAPCGAYGNRNFWFMWQEWFGSTYAGVHITSPLRVTSKYGNTAFSDLQTTVSFDITNDSSTPIDVGGMAVAVRDASGGNHDFSLKQMTIPARSTVTYSDARVLNKEDVYTFSIANYSGGQWKADYPSMVNATEPRSKTVTIWKSPTLTGGVTLDSPLQAGKTHTVTYRIQNNSTSTRNVGSLGLAVRGPNNESLDPSPAVPLTLAAGESRLLSYSFKPQAEGRYTFSIAAKLDDWVAAYPMSLNDTIKSSFSAVAAPKVVLGSALTSTSNDPRTGQTTTLQFKVKNNSEDTVDLGKLGLWGRDPQGRNIDPGVVAVALSSGEEKTVTMQFKPSQKGQYSFGILGSRNDVWNDGPASPDAYSRSTVVAVKEAVVISGGVLLDGSQSPGYQGQRTAIGFKVKNFSEDTVDLGKLGLWGRDPQGRNIDPGVVAVTLNPGQERLINFPISFLTKGTYTFGVLQTKNGGASWGDGPDTEGSAKKSLSLPVATGVVVSQGTSSSINPQGLHNTQSTNILYTVKNPTNSTINLGKLGLWGRDPQGRNVDPGVTSTVLAPGEERVISFAVRLGGGVGEYRFGVLQTVDDGYSWSNGPDLAAGQNATIQFNAKQNITLTSSLGASPGKVSIGQCQTLSYRIKNFDVVNSVNLGKLGLWGRDPQGRNIDPGVAPVTIGANEEKTISSTVCLTMRGSYSFGILQTVDDGRTWTNGPQKESDGLLNTIQLSID